MKIKVCSFIHCNNSFKARSNKKFCSRNCKEKNKKYKNSYRYHKKNYCEQCGFIPKHLCQLDVDHIDGNHKNNDESNLQTLCSNCHRLKTYLNMDWTY